MAETMPAHLRAISEQVRLAHQAESNLDSLRHDWQAHAARARQQMPGIHIEAEGETICLGELSPGCRACKEGAWDCIFITMRCNLTCEFCCSPHASPADYYGSAFGATPEQIAANHARTHIAGISFSGGEPFVEANRLFDWVARFKDHSPDKYYWVYTNGLLAHEENLRTLGQLGIDEIRFNVTATGYDHPAVMRNLASATRFISTVTIEIPAIPEHVSRLLACLADWCALGVRFLNLHELMVEPGTNAARMAGARQVVVLADGHRTEINPESRALTLAVMRKVRDAGLPLSVNDCSLQNKLRQLRGRRRSLAPLVQAPYEKMIGDQFYESYCAYQGEEKCHFFHPDTIREMRQQYPDYQFVRLARLAPLSLGDRGKWIAFEQIRVCANR